MSNRAIPGGVLFGAAFLAGTPRAGYAATLTHLATAEVCVGVDGSQVGCQRVTSLFQAGPADATATVSVSNTFGSGRAESGFSDTGPTPTMTEATRARLDVAYDDGGVDTGPCLLAGDCKRGSAATIGLTRPTYYVDAAAPRFSFTTPIAR